MTETTINETSENNSLISAFITNLGKYNGGELVGEWLPLPTSAEELSHMMKRIGIDGEMYEEYFITDYDINVEGLSGRLGEYESLDELNYLAAKLDDMSPHEIEKFEAVLQYGDVGKTDEIINLLEGSNLDDCYDFIPEIDDDSDLGYYWVEESGAYDTKSMGNLANYIDYERFGRDIRLDEGGAFVSPRGYIRMTGDSADEIYDGEVPEEYAVLSCADDEPSIRQGSGLMSVLIVRPGEEPVGAQIAPGLESLQAVVGGMIQATYPYNDPVAIICNEEGKVNGLPLNRALYDENGEVYDIIAGDFIISGLGAEDFTSLPSELAEKYREKFKDPEDFVRIAGKILAVKHPADIKAAHEVSEKPKPHGPEL